MKKLMEEQQNWDGKEERLERMRLKVEQKSRIAKGKNTSE